MLEKILKNKKILSDIVLSIMSSVLPIFILQLLILPAVSKTLDNDIYGMLITIISYINVLPSAMGNVINNIRLLKNNEYMEMGEEGDFSILFLGSCGVNLVALAIFTYIYKINISLMVWILVCILAFLVSAYEYFNVAFRITLDYKATFVSNVFLSLGYIIGFMIFKISNIWPAIYILGYLSALVYILKKTTLWREKICITPLFKDTLTETVTLFVAGLIGRLINYADKLLIYPILGGKDVAIYYAASIIGKMISMMISPISNVVLSYIAKMKKQKRNIFWQVFLIAGLVGTVGYFICVMLSQFILQFLYPQYMEVALTYIPITTATAVVTAMVGIMNPFVLKFVDMKWQIFINIITLIMYTFFSLGLLNFGGMIGFCWGVLIANIFKLLFVILLYQFKVRKGQESVSS